MNPLERAAIVLQLVIESIQAIVNREVMRFSDGTVDVSVTFGGASQRSLVNVLLADMLEPVDPDLLDFEGSLLDALEAVVTPPPFGASDAGDRLQEAAAAWREWLGQEIEVTVNLSLINLNPTLRLRRMEFVTICGNVSKHNMSRLTRNARRLGRILGRQGVAVSSVEALCSLDDFQARFHDDILSYHATTIAELLTNLRWAIHEYLLPQFYRSYRACTGAEDRKYTYEYPDDIAAPYARMRYWDLMNAVREGPWLPRFTGSPSLKGQY